jgi:tyrosyl-tRNA synthetase
VAGESLQVERPSKWGGPVTFWNIQELEQAYLGGDLHPLDLKNAVSAKLSLMLEPCRRHFQNNNKAKHLLEAVEGYKVTR